MLTAHASRRLSEKKLGNTGGSSRRLGLSGNVSIPGAGDPGDLVQYGYRGYERFSQECDQEFVTQIYSRFLDWKTDYHLKQS